MEIPGRDTDNRGLVPIHPDLLPDGAGIAAEPFLPIRISQHRDRLLAPRIAFARKDEAAGGGLYSQSGEKVS